MTLERGDGRWRLRWTEVGGEGDAGRGGGR